MKKHPSNPDSNHPYYSSDLLARSLVRAGIPRYKSYQLVHSIWEDLGQKKKDEKTLVRKVLSILKDKYPESISKYKEWQKIIKKNKPTIILIGGGTGIGTSTLAVRLGWLLEINQILGTDAIREVIRQFLPREIEPLLNISTYETGDYIKSIKSHEDSIIYGFLSQSRKVIYGVEAIIKRAIKEKNRVVIEGVHIIPGEMKFLDKYKSKAHIIQIMLDVNNPETHKQHFFARQLQNANRSKTKYLKYFKEIRLIRDFLITRAKQNKIPIIENYILNQAEKEILEVIYSQSCPKKR